MKVKGLLPSEKNHKDIKRVLRDNDPYVGDYRFTVTFSKWVKTSKVSEHEWNKGKRVSWKRTMILSGQEYEIRARRTTYTAYVNGYSNWKGTKQVPTYEMTVYRADDDRQPRKPVYQMDSETRMDCMVNFLYHLPTLRQRWRKEEEE